MEFKFKGPMTRSEVADIYKTTPDGLRDKLKRAKIDLPPGPIYPIDLLRIFDKLGNPFELEEKLSKEDINLKE